MGTTRKHYDKEFKPMIVDLLSSGKSAKELGLEYSIYDSTIRKWRRELDS